LNNPLRYTDPSGEFLGSWISGFIQGFFSTGSNRFSTGLGKANQLLDNDWGIIKGLFKTDSHKNFWGQTWELVSRFTWQAPQTMLGYKFTRSNNFLGQIDKVDYYGGATAASGSFFNQDGAAVTISNYIIGSRKLSANPHNSLFQHEYGHYLQSQEMGPAYLNRVGIPSLLSVDNHNYHPVEQDANRRAFLYFNKYVDGFYKSKEKLYDNTYGWNFKENPLDINNSNSPGQYVDYYDSNDLEKLNKLTVHAQWHDYMSWTIHPKQFILSGLQNSLYYFITR
jgi:hypothetical protein